MLDHRPVIRAFSSHQGSYGFPAPDETFLHARCAYYSPGDIPATRSIWGSFRSWPFRDYRCLSRHPRSGTDVTRPVLARSCELWCTESGCLLRHNSESSAFLHNASVQTNRFLRTSREANPLPMWFRPDHRWPSAGTMGIDATRFQHAVWLKR